MTPEPPHVAAHEISLLVDLISKRCNPEEQVREAMRDWLAVRLAGTELGRELEKRGWLSSGY